MGSKTFYALLFLTLVNASISVASRPPSHNVEGKKWAILVAGSNGYWNYRHQADICHAYQILKNGGLKDENIIVFMYDDIALNEENPRRGIVINKPNGGDVYKGVPKDYTGEAVNAKNFFAVLLGNKGAVKGGSGKVVDSGPNDQIFIYYSDHGSPGLVEMPSGDSIYAKDFVEALKKKHAAKTFKSMVIYMEACESGSIFEGLLPKDLNIYVLTASNKDESSYATYCPDDLEPPPKEYTTCLGDLFSVAWMEDCDKRNSLETMKQQYELVMRRTLGNASIQGSHVKQYGNLEMQENLVSMYIGDFNPKHKKYSLNSEKSTPSSSFVNQYDADLLHFKHKFQRAPKGSEEKLEAYKQLQNEIACRTHVEESIHRIASILFGKKSGSTVINAKRLQGKPVVDDWDKFKVLVKTYEKQCGSLKGYATKFVKAIANICNTGISVDQMVKASVEACQGRPRNPCKTI